MSDYDWRTGRLMGGGLLNFYRKVQVGHDCWLWLGSKDRDGYGKHNHRRRYIHAHRFVYELVVGDLRPGLNIDHLCRNRACVNPRHLEQVTIKENVLRGTGLSAVNRRKTHCTRGHPFNALNTYSASNGGRGCRTCRKLYRVNA